MRKVYLIALAGAVACASTTTGIPRQPTDRNVIYQTELESVGSSNLYELIERVRPNFLRSRGPTSLTTAGDEYPIVFVDGRRYGDLASLKSLITSQVSEVRYYDASAAAAKFGMINAPGVIDVHIKQ
jgi:hypothetical protein